MRRLSLGVMVCLFSASPLLAGDDAKRVALKKFNDFIGEWKGAGTPDKPKPDPRETWKENVSWSWKFQGNDAWLVFVIKDGKNWKGGEIRSTADGKGYELTTIDVKDQKMNYRGQRDEKGYFTFESVDAATGDTHQIVMNTAAEGVRLVYRYAVKPKGRTVFTKVFQVAATKDGEALGVSSTRKTGRECIVTGGLGTMTVSYKGQTYYVCCTGCKEAFEANPEKYVKEAQKK